MNIYINNEMIDVNNISIKDYKKDTEILKDKLSRIKLNFSSIGLLKGDKILLEKSFQQQKAESLNL